MGSHISDKDFFIFLSGEICRRLCADMSFEYYDMFANDERHLTLRIENKPIGNIGLSNIGIFDGKVNHHEVAKVAVQYFYERIKERLIGLPINSIVEKLDHEITNKDMK